MHFTAVEVVESSVLVPVPKPSISTGELLLNTFPNGYMRSFASNFWQLNLSYDAPNFHHSLKRPAHLKVHVFSNPTSHVQALRTAAVDHCISSVRVS